MRAKESRRTGDRIIEDKEAERLVNSITYDYSKFDHAKLSAVGCTVRCWYMGHKVREFIHTHICIEIVSHNPSKPFEMQIMQKMQVM